MIRPPPRPTPFPYTTLFRSHAHGAPAAIDDDVDRPAGPAQGGDCLLRRADRPTVDRGDGVAGLEAEGAQRQSRVGGRDRKSTRLNSSHSQISYAVFCLKKKK